MIKTKPLLIKNESKSAGSVEAFEQSYEQSSEHRSAHRSSSSAGTRAMERSVHRSLTEASSSPDIGSFISRLGGIDGITKTIVKLQKLIQAVTPLLPLIGIRPNGEQETRKAKFSPKAKQRRKRKL